MRELAKHVEAAARSPNDPLRALDDAGKQWAQSSLGLYTGERLRCALAISAAIADFTALWERDE